MTRGGSTYYYHLDGLGSVKEITDSTGSTVEKYRYDVYGQPAIFDGLGNPLTESAIGNSYMFTGRRYDKESGLYYYRARYYNSVSGRFLQMDPITWVPNDPRIIRPNDPIIANIFSFRILSFFLSAISTETKNLELVIYQAIVANGIEDPQILHRYIYVGNNPLNFIDPLGLWNWKAFGKGVLKGLGGVAIGFGVGAIIVATLPASAATVLVTGLAVTGAAGVGLMTGQVITGRTLTGKKLSDEKRSEMAGEALVGWAAMLSFTFKAGGKGMEPDHIGFDLPGGRNIIHYGRHVKYGRHIGLGFAGPYKTKVHIYPGRPAGERIFILK